MNIVVFGAAGWTGRAVLSNLAGRHQIRAFDRNAAVWETWQDVDGDWQDGELAHGDIVDFSTVHDATDGMDAVIHLAVYPSSVPGSYSVDDIQPFMINLKGLWNVLESARQRGIRRVVHVGSCQAVHSQGIFFSADVRRRDGRLYGLTKRLQEEMCRQFHEAHNVSTIVLRPDYIVDSQLGIGRFREKLGQEDTRTRNGWVCRHDLAQACRLATESETIEFDVFHIVGTPEADRTCNVARSRDILGVEYRGDLQQYR